MVELTSVVPKSLSRSGPQYSFWPHRLQPELSDDLLMGRYRTGAATTRQMTLPTSSATSSAPRLSSVTPTGRPLAAPLALRKPVSTSTGIPDGLPASNGT